MRDDFVDIIISRDGVVAHARAAGRGVEEIAPPLLQADIENVLRHTPLGERFGFKLFRNRWFVWPSFQQKNTKSGMHRL